MDRQPPALPLVLSVHAMCRFRRNGALPRQRRAVLWSVCLPAAMPQCAQYSAAAISAPLCHSLCSAMEVPWTRQRCAWWLQPTLHPWCCAGAWLASLGSFHCMQYTVCCAGHFHVQELPYVSLPLFLELPLSPAFFRFSSQSAATAACLPASRMPWCCGPQSCWTKWWRRSGQTAAGRMWQRRCVTEAKPRSGGRLLCAAWPLAVRCTVWSLAANRKARCTRCLGLALPAATAAEDQRRSSHTRVRLLQSGCAGQHHVPLRPAVRTGGAAPQRCGRSVAVL